MKLLIRAIAILFVPAFLLAPHGPESREVKAVWVWGLLLIGGLAWLMS